MHHQPLECPLTPPQNPEHCEQITPQPFPHPPPPPLACRAADRLRLWKPAQADPTPSSHPQLPDDECECIKDLKNNTWQESTRISYATRLLTYHIFCDQKNMDEL